MRIPEGNQTNRITMNGADARQRAVVVPVQGEAVGQHEVDRAAAQADEDRDWPPRLAA